MRNARRLATNGVERFEHWEVSTNNITSTTAVDLQLWFGSGWSIKAPSACGRWETFMAGPDWSSSAYRSASNVLVALQTGGRAGVRRSNLFSFSGWAMERTQLGEREMAKNRLSIPGAGVKLGSDGMGYTVLPDNREFDITLKAPALYYRFDVYPIKHKLKIVANSIPLADNKVTPSAIYCAGQKMSFYPTFSPMPSGVESKTLHWSFTGSFVNTWEQWHDPDLVYWGSKNYYLTNTLLMLEDTSGWWLRGGNPTPERQTAQLNLLIQFSNGQAAFLSKSGLLSIYQPSLTFNYSVVPPYAAPQVVLGHVPGQIAIQVGDDQGVGDMHFSVSVVSLSSFPGEVIATQLINSWWSAIVNNPPITVGDSTGSEYWLDRAEIYPNSHENVELDSSGTTCSALAPFNDQPSLGILAAQWASRNDSFKTYWRFRPSGDDAIYITLGRVNWGWFGNAVQTAPFEWQITSSGVTGPTFSITDEQPHWKMTD